MRGEGIAALFARPLSHPPCCLLLSGVGDSCARLSHTRTASGCDVFCPPLPPYPSLPMIIDLSVAGVISGSRAVLSPRVGEGGLKKRDCFRRQKKHPGGRSPPPSQNGEVAEAPFCGEVFRGLVESYSSELCVSGGRTAGPNAKRRGRRWAVRRAASEKKCRSHSAPARNYCSCWRLHSRGRCIAVRKPLAPGSESLL